MFVFIDESGNSGQNIADPKSPIFYHLALFSKGNIDLDLNHSIQNILNMYNLDELHGYKLSSKKIEGVSSFILKLLKENNVHFFFATVQKSFLAYAKLYDTLFDNVENIGARWDSYQLRPLRLMLLCNLMGIIEPEVAFDFYKHCLMATSQQSAEDALRHTCKIILSETYKLKDSRSKTIIEDAINGAKSFPKEITMFEESKKNRWRHLPHLVSFWPMLNAISLYSKKHKSKVHKIFHDEQDQVQYVIKEMHQVAVQSKEINLLENGSYDFKNIPEKSFELKDSTTSYGIQVCDLCLTILKGEEPNSYYYPNTAGLYNYIKSHLVDTFFFDDKTLLLETSLWYKKIMNANISMEQIAAGRKFVEDMDKDFYEKLLEKQGEK